MIAWNPVAPTSMPYGRTAAIGTTRRVQTARMTAESTLSSRTVASPDTSTFRRPVPAMLALTATGQSAMSSSGCATYCRSTTSATPIPARGQCIPENPTAWSEAASARIEAEPLQAPRGRSRARSERTCSFMVCRSILSRIAPGRPSVRTGSAGHPGPSPRPRLPPFDPVAAGRSPGYDEYLSPKRTAAREPLDKVYIASGVQ